jgi:hypothetical protein
MVRNMNKIDGFVGHFHKFYLKCAEKVKGFNPDGIFIEHLLVVSLNISFTDAILNEEQDNASGIPSLHTSNLETILNTNDSYKQKRKGLGEKSSQSPTTTPNTTASWRSTPMAYPRKKVTHSSLGEGGDKNPPFEKIIESSQKLPTSKKHKKIVLEHEGLKGEIDTHDLSLEYMELEIDIEKMFPDNDQLERTAPHNPEMEIIGTDTLDEEESFSFQSAIFDSESKRLVIENRDVKNKKEKSRSEINLRNMDLSQISQIHQSTRDALYNSIRSLEAENVMLKE